MHLVLWQYAFSVSAGDFFLPGIIKTPLGYRVFGALGWHFEPATPSTTPVVNIVHNGPVGTYGEDQFGNYAGLDRISFDGTVDQDGTFTLFVPLVPVDALHYSYS